MASQLPPGWRIDALITGDKVTPVGAQVSDQSVEAADTIRVRYQEQGAEPEYRLIHGATGKAQVGDLITRVTKIVSPPKGRRGR